MANALTKSQLVSIMAEKTELSKADVKEFFDTFTELAFDELRKNGEVSLPGFGKLLTVDRKARKGRNPATGETIDIPAKTVVKFKMSKATKECLD